MVEYNVSFLRKQESRSVPPSVGPRQDEVLQPSGFPLSREWHPSPGFGSTSAGLSRQGRGGRRGKALRSA